MNEPRPHWTLRVAEWLDRHDDTITAWVLGLLLASLGAMLTYIALRLL